MPEHLPQLLRRPGGPGRLVHTPQPLPRPGGGELAEQRGQPGRIKPGAADVGPGHLAVHGMQTFPQEPQVRRRGRDQHRTPGPRSSLDETGYTRRQLIGAPVRHGRMLQPG